MIKRLILGASSQVEFSMFEAWHKSADSLYNEFVSAEENFDPFNFNEVASVSFLTAAAGRAGFAPIMESTLVKSHVDDKGHKRDWKGRSDLLIFANQKRYAFEFKTCWRNPKEVQIVKCLELAKNDILASKTGEGVTSYAAIVTSFSNEDAFARCEAFELASFSFSVMKRNEFHGGFFYFKEVESRC